MARTDPRPNYGKKRRVDSNGYVTIWHPNHPLARADGYVYEHRRIAWDTGLLTDPTHHVHHRNEIKTDNRLENLEVLTAAAHALEHLKAGYVTNQYGTWVVGTGPDRRRAAALAALGDRTCNYCGGPIADGVRVDARFCSKRCRNTRWKRAHFVCGSR